MNLRCRLAVVLVFAVSIINVASIGASTPDPVPMGHWAYDVITHLAKYGVSTGRPDGWFKGRRPVPRSEFAETLCFILGEAERLEGEGALWVSQRRKDSLARLVTEFRPELAARGAEATDIESGQMRLERVWRDPRPRGVVAPLPGSSRTLLPRWPVNLTARHEGYREALAEWERGEVVLYSLPDEHPISLDAPLPKAIPLKPISNIDNPRALQRALGHNAAMWKWLREKGPSDERRFGWLRQVFDLKSLASGQKPVQLEPNGATSPDGAILVKPRHPVHGYYLTANDRDLNLEFLDMPFFFGYRGFNVKWGEASTGVLRFDVDLKSGRRTYAIDCRTGCVLNAR